MNPVLAEFDSTAVCRETDNHTVGLGVPGARISAGQAVGRALALDLLGVNSWLRGRPGQDRDLSWKVARRACEWWPALRSRDWIMWP